MSDLASDSESVVSLSVGLSPGPSSGFVNAVGLGHPRMWDYFLYDSETNKSTCQVFSSSSSSEFCGHSISGKYPTNLKLHMKKVHPEEYKEIKVS